MTQTITAPTTQAAQQLRQRMLGVRLNFHWLGVRRSLNREQKQQAASAFDASSDYVAASKKLFDTRHPAFRAVTSIKNQATNLWKGMTLPFPEPGIRLLKHEDLDPFDARMQQFREQLREAVIELEHDYEELRQAARERLGQLFKTEDYPSSLIEEFAIEWDFPSVEPPSYLRQLQPELYDRECRRVQAQFDEAVQLAEQAFLDEFQNLVSHLCERLAGADDGRPKVFRDSAVDNLHTFFERFRRLEIGSSSELQQLVSDAQGLLRGVEPRQLRESHTLRSETAEQLTDVRRQLDVLLVDRPRRNILRQPRDS